MKTGTVVATLARRRLAAGAVTALAFALAAATIGAESGRRAERRAVLAELAALSADGALDAAARERLSATAERVHQPAALRLALARRLVDQAVAGAGDDSQAAARRLDLARRYAADAFFDRPAAWRAPMLLGAATYLARTLRRERELVTASAEWDAPLAWSRELAPASLEPARFTVLAYLELWPALSPEKRETAAALLRVTLDNRRFFDRLIEPWLAVADDRDTAFAALPDRAWIWRQLGERYAKRGDWRTYVEVRQRWRGALGRELDARLDEAAALARRGDGWEARQDCLQVIADAPLDAVFLPQVERALAEAPAGPPLPSQAALLRRWLEWVLAQSLTGTSPLSPAALDRLAAAVAELPAPLAAHAAVAAGRLADGELLERRRFVPGDLEWGGYLVAKARRLAAREPRAALAALARTETSWQRRPSYLAAVAAAARADGDAATAAAAERTLAATAALGSWNADDAAGARWWRELAVDGAAGGLAIAGAASGEVMVEVRLDGRTVAAQRARTRGLRFAAAVAPGLHLVEVVPIAGGRFTPGELRLLPAQGALAGAGAGAGADDDG